MTDWQKDIFDRLAGITPGQMNIISSCRQTGKSQLIKLWQQIYYQDMPSLTLKEGSVYGQPYYAVECLGYIWDDLHDWCTDSFGATAKNGVWEPGCRWYENNTAFWFREAKDRDWFVMRWS